LFLKNILRVRNKKIMHTNLRFGTKNNGISQTTAVSLIWDMLKKGIIHALRGIGFSCFASPAYPHIGRE
jgi:hypothetical protein